MMGVGCGVRRRAGVRSIMGRKFYRVTRARRGAGLAAASGGVGVVGFETGKNTHTINTILITMFNHQTHHRGQIHNMLSQAGIKPPQIDIPDFTTQ